MEYEIAVLKSNIAACHLKLEDWKAAVDEATKALDALGRLEKDEKKGTEEDGGGGGQNGVEKEDDGGVIELNGEGDDFEELEKLKMSDQRRDDVRRIKAKALMRRAKGRTEQGGWANLQGAEEGKTVTSEFLRLLES